MKKTLFLAALAAVSLVSCTKDQIVEIQQDEIKFNVVADNATKASAVYCANNTMTEFSVYAITDSKKKFIDGDLIEYEDGAWQNQTAVRYWPESGSLDFYAVVNGSLTFDATTPSATIENFQPETVVANQKDLLYAVAIGETKASAPVNMNFRHALSQIEFMAKNENSNLYVEIEEVKIGQVYTKGTYTLCNSSTATNFIDHTQGTNATLNRGGWTFDTGKSDYTVAVYPTSENLVTQTAAAVKSGQTVNLTCSVDASGSTRDFSKSLLLLPTVNTNNPNGLTKWTPKSGETAFDGTYIGVKCAFYNVSSGSATVNNIVAIQSSTWVYLPVDIKWEEGKKYIYTFVFTKDGNGGYTGGSENPQPALTPITYSVTVDDFEKGDNTNHNLNVIPSNN